MKHVLFSILLLGLGFFSAKATSAQTLPHACNVSYGSVFNWWSLQGEWTMHRNTKYLEKYRELFAIGPEEGQGNWWQISTGEHSYNWSKVDQVQSWFAENNKDYIYSTVVWHEPTAMSSTSAQLKWYKDLPTNGQRQEALSRHVQTLIARFRGKASQYFLVNHAVINGNSDNYMLTGWDKVTAQAKIFKWAVAADPKPVYLINEQWPGINVAQATTNYVTHIQQLLAQGARIDAIGLMGHMGMCDGKVPTNAVLSESLDEIGSLGLPVHITEFDVSYDRCNINGGDRTENFNPNLPFEGFANYYLFQEATYKRLMELFTSKPFIKQISFWGFYDGRHWRKDGGFFYESQDPTIDFTPKPAFAAVEPFLTYEGCYSLDPNQNGKADLFDLKYLIDRFRHLYTVLDVNRLMSRMR